MKSDDEDSGTRTVDEQVLAKRTSAPRLAGDRYRLGEQIGRGGMGEVVVARDEQLGRDVAIKRIRTGEPSDLAVKRFLREARIQGRLEHPAIPPVHELGRDTDGMPFFAMKKLAGRTLSSILKDNPDAAQRKRLLRAFADICLAVEFAHVNGIIHRDLKPDNIVLGDFGEVYVIDWGVAKIVDEPDEDFRDIPHDGVHTSTGAAVGTPGYMAPEQERAASDVDERADVFALGRVLERILEGDAQVAPELDELSMRATQRDREQRIQTARKLGEGVQRFLDGDRDLEQRRRLAGEHLDRARGAFASDDRANAMREAGRALALDPQLTGAGDLISRLMLEPPATTPPEVQASLHEDAVSRMRLRLRYHWGYLGYIAIVPGLINAGSTALVLVALATLAFSVIISVAAALSDRTPSWLPALGNVPLVMLLAYLFTPVVVAPGVAAVLATTVGTHPLLRRGRQYIVIGVMLLAAAVVPLFAELAGVVPRTYDVNDNGVLLHAVAFLHGGYSHAALLAYIAALIGTALFIPYALRGGENELRRKLFVQTWQLRQLAPDR